MRYLSIERRQISARKSHTMDFTHITSHSDLIGFSTDKHERLLPKVIPFHNRKKVLQPQHHRRTHSHLINDLHNITGILHGFFIDLWHHQDFVSGFNVVFR